MTTCKPCGSASRALRQAAGRDAAGVTLVGGVEDPSRRRWSSRRWPPGQRAFGENYVQEALEKMDARAGRRVEWHLIGPLQSNKTRIVAERFDWVHSVDSEKIARRLSEQRPAGPARRSTC